MTSTTDLQAAVDAIPFWYHRIELPGGIVTPGSAPLNAKAYRIPDDLTGKRVLDVGAWDGYWSFEAAKRGAEYVLAIDDFSDTIGGNINADRSGMWESFDLCKLAIGFGGNVQRKEYDIEEPLDDLSPYRLMFNTIFCFGVLYHTRNPMRILDNLYLMAAASGTIHIESAILDNCPSAYNKNYRYSGNECVAEFYPRAEYGNNPSNWWVPTLRCLAAMVEAAGFRNVEAWRLTNTPKHICECRGFVRAEV